MAIYFDIETDTLYLRGKAAGEAKAKVSVLENYLRTVVNNLLANTDFDDSKIATLVDVSVEYVQKIRQELDKLS